MGAQLRGRFEKYVWKIYLRKHRQAECSRTVRLAQLPQHVRVEQCDFSFFFKLKREEGFILPAFAFPVVTAGCPTQTQTA